MAYFWTLIKALAKQTNSRMYWHEETAISRSQGSQQGFWGRPI